MRGPWPRGVGFYGLLGAILVMVGGFLPWITGNGKSLTAWDIPALSIATNENVGGPAIGVLLLAVVLVLVPYAIRRPMPWFVRLLLAGVAINTAGAILVTVLRHGAPVSLGVGVVVTLAGAVLMIVGEAGQRRAEAVG